MSTTVSFPGLGLEFSVNRVAFSIGGFEIYWYGILIGLGLALGMIYALTHAREFGIDADRMLDVIIWGTIFGVIGARVYYVAFAPQGMFTGIRDILDMRKGGVAFYGTVIGAILAAFVACKIRKVKFLPMVDSATVGFLVGQGIGRWGNFFNQEAFGINTTLPWGMTSETVTRYLTSHSAALEARGIFVDPMMPVHPTFLYESLWCLLGALVFILYAKRRKFDGEMTLMYFAWNGFGRAFIEGLRTDSLYVGEIRISQMLAIVGAALALLMILVVRVIINRRNDPAFLLPYGHTEACAVQLAEFERERQEKSRKKKGKAADEPEPEQPEAEEPVPVEAVRADEAEDADAPDAQPKSKPVPANRDGGKKPAKPASRRLDAQGNELAPEPKPQEPAAAEPEASPESEPAADGTEKPAEKSGTQPPKKPRAKKAAKPEQEADGKPLEKEPAGADEPAKESGAQPPKKPRAKKAAKPEAEADGKPLEKEAAGADEPAKPEAPAAAEETGESPQDSPAGQQATKPRKRSSRKKANPEET